MIQITKNSEVNLKSNLIIIYNKKIDLKTYNITDEEKLFIEKQINNKKEIVILNRYHNFIFIVFINEKDNTKAEILEKYRRAGSKLIKEINNYKLSEITVIFDNEIDKAYCITEGLAMANYQFIKYITKADEKRNSLIKIELVGNIDEKIVEELSVIIEAIYKVRDLINEPFNVINSLTLADEIKAMGKKAGFNVTVLNKKQIEDLKFGGLLAVNKGSTIPPAFSIIEWKPENYTNKKPIVLVGKGVVYDSGGLSLKPTTDSMDYMKSDMAGAAIVAGTIYAAALNKINKYIIGLIPSTDNKPSADAYVPGDIITIYDGTTVEVLNTDAEGRLILADALSYARKYNPEVVINIATLTGSAAMAVGKYGIVAMESKAERQLLALKESAQKTFERVVEFPLWDDYKEEIKSDIADLKNVGGKEGGAITAGKFLQHFSDYPFIHLDIAGVSFFKKTFNYYPKGATANGLRLLYNFIKNYQ